MVRTSFAIFACSPPLQLFAADKLGYGTAFLFGCDFAFPDNKERFTNWTLKKIYSAFAAGDEKFAKYVDATKQYYSLVDQ
jgi:hypothetical protein